MWCPELDVARDVDSHQRLIERFLAEVESNPDDPLPVHMLAQIYFSTQDFANARRYSERLIEIGADGENIFLAMLRIAQSMDKLDTPWLDVQDAYMRAWEFPTDSRRTVLWHRPPLQRRKTLPARPPIR